jgi:hypothetical protein
MAIKRLTIDGYGQIELNNVAFRRDGRIEAQCAPDTTDFSSAKVENGMLLAVDGANRKVKFAVDGSLPIALNYSAEHMYDERTPGLKNFYLNGNGKEDFLPRLGYLSVGDKFTTNCICYDATVDTDWTTESAFVSALASYKSTTLYGGISSEGAILVSATAPTVGPKLKVIEKTTMPDATLGVKFQVLVD